MNNKKKDMTPPPSMLMRTWVGSFIATNRGLTTMTYDELKKVEGRVPSTPEQMAKPIAEALVSGMAFILSKARPIQFFVSGAEEKRTLITKRGIPAAHIWTVGEIRSYAGDGVTLAEVARGFVPPGESSNGEDRC